MLADAHSAPFPTPLDAYPPPSPDGLLATLSARSPIRSTRVATAIFAAGDRAHLRRGPRSRRWRIACSTRTTTRERAPPGGRRRRASRPRSCTSSAKSKWCSGCGRWCSLVAMTASRAGRPRRTTSNDTVNYTEPLFVVVIMALASTRPIVGVRRSGAAPGRRPRRRHAGGLVGHDPHRRPAARLVHHRAGGDDDLRAAARAAVLRSRAEPRLKYATLGLLFVNVSIGGTLTHFAAPPVLMVARPWGWDTPFMLGHFGWRAALAVVRRRPPIYFLMFRRELRRWRSDRRVPDIELPEKPATSRARAAAAGARRGSRSCTLLFMAWTVRQRALPGAVPRRLPVLPRLRQGDRGLSEPHRSARRRCWSASSSAGLVIHGGLQGWWIAPVLASLSETPLFFGATRADGVQRQRADHLSRDAGAGSERAAEDRRRRRRGDRRRPDGDRQRARTPPAGAARPLLRRRRSRRSACCSRRSCRRSSRSSRFGSFEPSGSRLSLGRRFDLRLATCELRIATCNLRPATGCLFISLLRLSAGADEGGRAAAGDVPRVAGSRAGSSAGGRARARAAGARRDNADAGT